VRMTSALSPGARRVRAGQAPLTARRQACQHQGAPARRRTTRARTRMRSLMGTTRTTTGRPSAPDRGRSAASEPGAFANTPADQLVRRGSHRVELRPSFPRVGGAVGATSSVLLPKQAELSTVPAASDCACSHSRQGAIHLSQVVSARADSGRRLIRAPTASCWRGSLTIACALTTWSGCAGRTDSAAHAVSVVPAGG
jgi:hypothetical protein